MGVCLYRHGRRSGKSQRINRHVRSRNEYLLRSLAGRLQRSADEWRRNRLRSRHSAIESRLARRVAIHVVCEWIGNSAAVGMEHYLRVTDSDFDRAATGGANMAQLAAEPSVMEAHAALGSPEIAYCTQVHYPQQDSNAPRFARVKLQNVFMAVQNPVQQRKKSIVTLKRPCCLGIAAAETAIEDTCYH